MKKTVDDVKNLILLINKIKLNNKPIANFWVIGDQYIYHYLEYELGLQIYNLFFNKEKYNITKLKEINVLENIKNSLKKFIAEFYLTYFKNKKKKILLFTDFEKRTYQAESYLEKNNIEYDKIAIGFLLNNQFLSIPFFSTEKRNRIKITNIDKKIYKYLSHSELIQIIFHLDDLYQKLLNQYYFSKKILNMFNYKLFISWDHLQNVLGTLVALNEKKIKSLFIQHKLINEKIPGFINLNIKDKYKLKLNEYYYVWGNNFKRKLITNNKYYNKVSFPNSTIKNQIKYKTDLKKKIIIYFFEAKSDLYKMQKILIKLQSLNYKIIIKLRENNNEELEILLKNLDPKKLMIKKFLTRKIIKNSLLIVCSRTSAFYEYLKFGKIILAIKTDYYLLSDFERDRTILAIKYKEFLDLNKSKFLNKISKFNKNKKNNIRFYNFEIFFKKILKDVIYKN